MVKGTAIYKKDTLNRHLKLKDHSIFKRKQKESRNNIITEFAKQYDKEKDTIIRQMKCIYFAVKNHISLDIFKIMQVNNAIKSRNYYFTSACSSKTAYN